MALSNVSVQYVVIATCHFCFTSLKVLEDNVWKSVERFLYPSCYQTVSDRELKGPVHRWNRVRIFTRHPTRSLSIVKQIVDNGLTAVSVTCQETQTV